MVKPGRRVITGTHYGLRDWLAQRVTAVVMAVYILWLVATMLASPPQDHAALKAIFSNQWIRIGSLLFLVSLFWHSWIGMRNILMDYVHDTGVRLTLQVLVILSLLVYTVWSVEILWNL
ncbi:MAG: succinate dehydrogenase, hydrophobic membrane anchor protein [Nitrosospira sp.]|nr:succinate dehydrogenase, hydrophobic membrane anchor protein [Nitrosospira sp.]